MTDLDRVVDALKARRLDLGLNQDQVGQASGLGPNVRDYEQNRDTPPTLEAIVAWADALGCDVTVAVRPERDVLGEQMRNRKLGVYRLHWKCGGSSVAAVGMLYDGSRWYAPANWTTSSPGGDRGNVVGTDWTRIARAELIEPYRYDPVRREAGNDDD